MNWQNQYEQFAQAVKTRSNVEDIAGFKVWRPPEKTEDLDNFLDKLALHYLSASSETREEIRSRFQDSDTLFYLGSYVERISERAGVARDLVLVRLGLAAISISDLRPDWRDSLYQLGFLYRAAQRAGKLDPMPLFREVALLSSGRGESSTSSLLEHFDGTAVCRELADIPQRDLLKCVKTGDEANVRAQLSLGADVNLKGPRGLTPLMAASSRGDTKTMRMLLDSGADLQVVDDDGLSALAYAAKGERRRAVELLLTAGASVSVKPQGLTLLGFLEAGGSPTAQGKIMTLLKEAGAL